jgi:hypothetical protein
MQKPRINVVGRFNVVEMIRYIATDNGFDDVFQPAVDTGRVHSPAIRRAVTDNLDAAVRLHAIARALPPHIEIYPDQMQEVLSTLIANMFPERKLPYARVVYEGVLFLRAVAVG